jgi:flagella synthesis protein FlgN
LSNDGITEPDSIHPNWLHTPEQQQHWDVLIQATQQAKELNRVNSLLVTRHMARNQATLAVLYRHNLNGNGSGMYGPNGQATGSRPRIPSYAAK